MNIKSAQFIKSCPSVKLCPKSQKPEFAFIGRSNVGKSSVINLIADRKHLAKTSGRPGKTQTINYFLINDTWHLVDLPGYGYAKTSHSIYKEWKKMIKDYLFERENLYCVFVLIDSRHNPQVADIEFLTWLGNEKIALAIIMTKIDKLSKQKLTHSRCCLEQRLYQDWQDLPPIFSTSAHKKIGKENIHNFINQAIKH